MCQPQNNDVYSKVPMPYKAATTASTSSSCPSSPSERLQVQWNESVHVIWIPSHHDLDIKLRSVLYTSEEEQSFNNYRHKVEMDFDGPDWRQAAEDDRMVVAWNGEKIHPVHYLDLNNERNPGVLGHEEPLTKVEIAERCVQDICSILG